MWRALRRVFVLLLAGTLAPTGRADGGPGAKSRPAVDPLAQVNAYCSKGVTADNNAAVELLAVLGPDYLDKGTRKQTRPARPPCRRDGRRPPRASEAEEEGKPAEPG